jgi:glycosyltransferase involved in cell wall biosynthesis
MGHIAGSEIADPQVQLSFIMMTQKLAPVALRLDGIYFNTRQDWESQNEPIRRSFETSDLIVYQSNFNKRLTETYFGNHKKSVVINNGTCFSTISNIQPLSHGAFDKYSEVWSCASSWRPHKRLKDNINYFLENAPSDSCLVVAGENPDHLIKHQRVFYVGKLTWEQCISLYKRSKKFIHLAFLDHCPNVVVDARASGCELIITSSGGTKELADKNSVIIKDLDWDMAPLDLYAPPSLDYSALIKNELEVNIDIVDVAKRYVHALENL